MARTELEPIGILNTHTLLAALPLTQENLCCDKVSSRLPRTSTEKLNHPKSKTLPRYVVHITFSYVLDSV